MTLSQNAALQEKELDAAELRIVQALAQHYYEAVPLEFRTYCSFTSEVSQRVLQHFGINAQRVACQAWCKVSEQRYAFGFVGNATRDDKWDGHVICVAGDYFVDTAIQHFQTEFGVKVPNVAMARRFCFPTQLIGGMDLAENKALWWLHPPSGFDLHPPENPSEMVEEYAARLIQRIRS